MMTHSRPMNVEAGLAEADHDALDRACEAISPVWPLDRWIAVNPWWGLRHLPMSRVAGLLRQRAPVSMLMPPEFYRDQWQTGRIRDCDLSQAGADPDRALELLGEARHEAAAQVPRLLHLAGPRAGAGVDLEAGVVNQVSQVCARYFDRRQAAWRHQTGTAGLYRFWRQETLADAGLEARLGLPGLRSALRDLPPEWDHACALVLARTGVGGDDLEAWCHSLLLAINGWASWSAGLRWQAALQQRESDEIHQLLAVALVWELLCLEVGGLHIKADWQRAWSVYRAEVAKSPALPQALLVWHRAYEIGFQRQLIKQLALAPQPLADTPARVQAVFCIDVRSEVLRRHLEHTSDQIQTLGFAGFFGLPIAHRGLDDHAPVPRLPGLLAPNVALQDSTGAAASDRQYQRQAEQRHARSETLRRARSESLSTFTLIEATGLAAGWKLLRDSLGLGYRPRPLAAHQRLHHLYDGDPLSDREKVSMAEGLLRGMSLTRGFAPLLTLVGHGSHTDNNPNQAGLACGACGGQNGGINARAAASLLNDPGVRAGLKARGIAIPDFTWVAAAEHCTVTDQVKILDRGLVPESHQRHLAEFEQSLAEAGRHSRRERATPLRLNGRTDEDLLKAMVKRTRSWSEVRPEWGLANNGAILFAPRSRTRGIDLGGRCFLHDYQPAEDPEGSVLTALLSAPMVVANWINMQYFASVTAPDTYGAGNKLLHSVVGGNIGVLEGNDGDLRIGLPMQSVHDGDRWRHEPVRLSVVIDAPRERIEAVLAEQPDVARLVENEWLFLGRWPEAAGDPEWYRDGEWHPLKATGQVQGASEQASS